MLLPCKTINRLEKKVKEASQMVNREWKFEVKSRDGQQETIRNQQISHIAQIYNTKEKFHN